MDTPTGSDSKFDTPSLSLVQEGIANALGLVGVGVWELLVPENLFSCSDGLYQLVGVEPVIGKLRQNFWPERVHPEDDPLRVQSYADFLQGITQAYEQTYRVRHEDGRWLTVLARANWVSRTDGRPGRCVLGYVIDVTVHSADVDRLRASEERFRMSVSALQGIIYDLDLRTQRSVREGLKRMLGYDRLEGDDGFDGWLAVVHVDDVPRLKAVVAEGRAAGKSFELTYRVRHQNGTWRHVHQRGTYLLGPDGKAIRAYGLIEDITDSEVQREQLQMQAAIIERMSEGVLLVSKDGTILFANPALERIFGYERGQLTGVPAQTLSFRSRSNFEGLLRTVFDGTDNDRRAAIDLEGRRSDNSLCPVQGYFSSMMLGTHRCVVAVLTDISERKRLERELMQAATLAQQRAGGDLHEGIGQQLTGIAMMLQSLGLRAQTAGVPALSREVADVVALVNAAISDTRTLARGLSPVRPTADGLADGFAELANHVYQHHRIHLRTQLELPAGLKLEETVATNLYRIAQEGVLNAARHSHAAEIQLRLRVAGADVELLVIDDGRGFDPLSLSRGGMGLGIMRFRAQMLGGYLSVESRPGAGTTIRCRCPVEVDREAA